MWNLPVASPGHTRMYGVSTLYVLEPFLNVTASAPFLMVGSVFATEILVTIIQHRTNEGRYGIRPTAIEET